MTSTFHCQGCSLAAHRKWRPSECWHRELHGPASSKNRYRCNAPRANSQDLESASECSERVPTHSKLVPRSHSFHRMTLEAPPRTASFLPAPPFELACTESRFPVLRPQSARHRSSFPRGVKISRHNEDLPCGCEMLSSHATQRHLHTELCRTCSKPVSLKREFASSHPEVLRRRTQSLQSARSCLRVSATDLRRASKPFVALRIDFRAEGSRYGASRAKTGRLHPPLGIVGTRPESSGSAYETLSVRARCWEERPCAASELPVFRHLLRDSPSLCPVA